MNFRDRLRTYEGRPDVCWEWPGFTFDGYGKVGANIDERGWRVWFAHRAAWTVLVGPIDPSLELDHLCRNRRCFNPRHLEPVTPRENTMRSSAPTARNAKKTHCAHGHEFTPDNTMLCFGKYGVTRQCQRCYDSLLQRRKEESAARAAVRRANPVCPRGHLRTEKNTGHQVTRRGYKQRYCRDCARERSAEKREARRQASRVLTIQPS